MEDQRFEKLLSILLGSIKAIIVFVLFIGFAAVYFIKFYNPADFVKEEAAQIASIESEPEISDEGIHVETGFIADENYELVVANCTGCHSSKLVTQNRATKEGWQNMIQWMQETQNLWELGENEEKIVEYLAKNYAPASQGRRANLQQIDWYELD